MGKNTCLNGNPFEKNEPETSFFEHKQSGRSMKIPNTIGEHVRNSKFAK